MPDGLCSYGWHELFGIKMSVWVGNFNWFYNNIWTVACVILMHIDAVEQFRQLQTPEDGHVGPKHVVLSESGKNNLLHYEWTWYTQTVQPSVPVTHRFRVRPSRLWQFKVPHITNNSMPLTAFVLIYVYIFFLNYTTISGTDQQILSSTFGHAWWRACTSLPDVWAVLYSLLQKNNDMRPALSFPSTYTLREQKWT
jgi:hypothetical protein